MAAVLHRGASLEFGAEKGLTPLALVLSATRGAADRSARCC